MDYVRARAQLLARLKQEIKDERVIRAMARVPRECFVPSEERYRAYEDAPLTIGFGQTISQPTIVARMTEALELDDKLRVLEVGTGSGYQTAILAELARFVVSTERLSVLAQRSGDTLRSLGYTNIEIHLAREILGWPEGLPYDVILVTSGAPSVPPDLLSQLAIGGRMVIPVGSLYIQELCKVTKQQNQNVIEHLGSCCFVPLIGKGAWEDRQDCLTRFINGDN